MGGLENIPKKHIFNVPDGYFEELPSRVQSRITAGTVRTALAPAYRYSLRYALPLLLVATLFYYYSRPAVDASSILASVETTDLILYLEESGLTTEDLIENMELDEGDLEAIESEAYDLHLPPADTGNMEPHLNTP